MGPNKQDIDPDQVFTELDQLRKDGSLSAAIADDKPKYQTSSTQPGKLEKVYPDGGIEVGKFVEGVFVVSSDTKY